MSSESTGKDPIVARNEEVVRRFIDAWAALDVADAMACLAPDIVYINQPLEPVVGLDDVRKIIQGILDRTKKVEWKLRNVCGRGKTVCTERLDCWDFDGKGWGLELPCIGMVASSRPGVVHPSRCTRSEHVEQQTAAADDRAPCEERTPQTARRVAKFHELEADDSGLADADRDCQRRGERNARPSEGMIGSQPQRDHRREHEPDPDDGRPEREARLGRILGRARQAAHGRTSGS